MTDTAGLPEFTITRVFDAPRELVFRAWTDPDQLARWLGPRGLTTPRSSIEMDVRPGGHWRATMIVEADGTEYPTGGTYREVLEPERLVFVWAEPGTTSPDRSVLITITFTELGGGKTEMTFQQVGPAHPGTRAGMFDGWSQAIEKLAESLS